MGLKIENILPRSLPLYKMCKGYCDRINGENSGNMSHNGELDLLRNVVKKCSIIFDVGAKNGEWTKLALGLNPLVEIHCFEPMKESFARLSSNKFPPNVYLNNFGISSESGVRDIYVETDSLYKRTGLHLEGGAIVPEKTETIKLETLDTYCTQRKMTTIDFLKMDIEGHEFAAFQGARRLLAEERILRIQFEYGGCNIDARVLLKDFFELFSNTNYAFYKIMPKKIEKIVHYDQRLENFQYKNLLLLHKSVQ
jgi:FkbM family methyltransferase